MKKHQIDWDISLARLGYLISVQIAGNASKRVSTEIVDLISLVAKYRSEQQCCLSTSEYIRLDPAMVDTLAEVSSGLVRTLEDGELEPISDTICVTPSVNFTYICSYGEGKDVVLCRDKLDKLVLCGEVLED